MVTVDKYIRKLLFEHDCVIIPDFGGLITHQVAAHYDTTQALFLPSSKRVAFNEVLKLDDGLLTYYISVHERIARDEAVSLVKKYVDDLRGTLKEGRTVSLDAIGSFSSNSEGKPVFEPDYSQNFNNDWFGLDAISVRSYTESKPEPVEEVEVVSEPESTEVSLAPVSTGIFQHTWVRWAAAAMLAGAVFTMSMMYRPVDNSLLSTLNPFYGASELFVSTLSKIPNVEFHPEKEPASPVLGEVAPVLTPTVWIPVDSAATPKIVPVSEPVTPVVANDVNQSTTDKPTVSGNYFLIAGSFEKMKNAVYLKDRLVQAGFDQATVMDAHTGRLIKVSVGAYKTFNRALTDKDRVDQLTQAESWVYHKK